MTHGGLPSVLSIKIGSERCNQVRNDHMNSPLLGLRWSTVELFLQCDHVAAQLRYLRFGLGQALGGFPECAGGIGTHTAGGMHALRETVSWWHLGELHLRLHEMSPMDSGYSTIKQAKRAALQN